MSSAHLFVWLDNCHSCTLPLAGLLIASGILPLLSFILSLPAVLCTAVVRRVFRAFVRVVSQRSFVYLAARRTIDCERNIVSIVVHPLSYWLFCARRWSAVSSVYLFVWLVNGHSCTLPLAGLLIASGILSLLSFILSYWLFCARQWFAVSFLPSKR